MWRKEGLLVNLLKLLFLLVFVSMNAYAKGTEVDENLYLQKVDEENPISFLELRDPFKKPVVLVDKKEVSSELELFDISQFQLIGTMTGPKRMRGLVIAPNGKTYFIKSGDVIGKRGGSIVKLTANRMVVKEKVINALGRAENVYTEVKLVTPGTVGSTVSVSSAGSGTNSAQ